MHSIASLIASKIAPLLSNSLSLSLCLFNLLLFLNLQLFYCVVLCCLVSWFFNYSFSSLLPCFSPLIFDICVDLWADRWSWSVYENRRNRVVLFRFLSSSLRNFSLRSHRSRPETNNHFRSAAVRINLSTVFYFLFVFPVSLSLSLSHSARQWFDSCGCVCVNETTRWIYVKPCVFLSLLAALLFKTSGKRLRLSLRACGVSLPNANIAEISHSLFLSLSLSVFDTWMRMFPNVAAVFLCLWQEESDCSPTNSEHLIICAIRKKKNPKQTNLRIERTIKINEHLTWRW